MADVALDDSDVVVVDVDASMSSLSIQKNEIYSNDIEPNDDKARALIICSPANTTGEIIFDTVVGA